jgi:hypothetical protein
MRVAAVILLLAHTVCAQVANLQRGLPVDLEDTDTAQAGSWSLQSGARWERTFDGRHRVDLEPQLQYGVTPALELRVGTPVFLGSATHAGSRNLQLMAAYRWLNDAEHRPAVATVVGVQLPTGIRTNGVDTQLTGATSKTVGLFDVIYLNGDWFHHAARHMAERADRYRVIAGWSRRLDEDTLLVADGLREQQPDRGETQNLIEVGLRRALGKSVVVSLGAGPGIGEESPDVRVSTGIELGF